MNTLTPRSANLDYPIYSKYFNIISLKNFNSYKTIMVSQIEKSPVQTSSQSQYYILIGFDEFLIKIFLLSAIR